MTGSRLITGFAALRSGQQNSHGTWCLPSGSSATRSGAQVNQRFKKILNYWGEFLTTEASRKVLVESFPRRWPKVQAWLSPEALQEMVDEVSSGEITVAEGQEIEKGDELGMFHFGGSTHCLVFRPGVELEFDFHNTRPGLDATNIPVRSRLAIVKP